MKPFILALLALALGTAPAGAQTPQTPAPAPQEAPQDWVVSDTRVASVSARIAFPRRLGTLEARRTQEFSHQGEHVDNAIQYGSPDNQVFATVYIYYPGLPHAGLAAFMTDHAIRTNEPRTRVTTPARLVAAGGVPDAAIRIDYDHYRGNLASSAAFIKTGRWIIKLRVSGPESRRAEVEAAMAALLAGVEFGVQNPAMAPHPLTVTPCPDGAGRTAARALPDPDSAELGAQALLATFDGGGMAATDEGSNARHDLPPRVPDRLCLSALNVRGSPTPLLRGEAGAPISVDGRTMAVVMIADNGTALEVVHAANLHRYIVLYHEVGMTSMLGGYDNVPSDAQLAEILGGGHTDASRIRVPVRHRPNGGTEIQLDMPPTPRPSGTE